MARLIITFIAVLLFGVGIYYSARDLDRVVFWPIFLNFAVVNPVSFLLSAVGLMQMAEMANRKMHFRDAFRATIFGRAMELTPLPGGAIASSAALIKSGADGKSVAKVMSASAILILCMSGAGLGLVIKNPVVTSGSALLFVLCGLWIISKVGFDNFISITLIRGLNVVVASLRFYLGFAAVDYVLEPLTAVAFSSSGVLTSIVGIAPAGLGIAESIAAGIALLVAVPPTTAFLAAACNRVASLAAIGSCFLFVTSVWRPKNQN